MNSGLAEMAARGTTRPGWNGHATGTQPQPMAKMQLN